VRARHKAWAVPYLSAHPEIVISSTKDQPDFFLAHPLSLEIGAGKGDFVLAMALRGGNWLALERESSIAGLLAKKVVESTLTNIRVYPMDFDAAVEDLKAHSFDAIYLNSSDPWPKKRHAKRRLTTQTRLKEMADLLLPGGHLYFKSDNLALYEFTKEEALKVGELILREDEEDYAFDPTKDAMSEYERNFRSQGLSIHRLCYQKKVA
jgi:tRNA (guanine-N7-)-methyltransferase